MGNLKYYLMINYYKVLQILCLFILFSSDSQLGAQHEGVGVL